MREVSKFLALAPAERRLLLGAAALLGAIAVGLRLLPFRTLRRIAASLGHPPARPARRPHPSADRIAWAITVASRYLPGTRSCLPQALAAELLLRRHGHPATLRLGVARNDGRDFRAHAWVESEGRVVFGATHQPRYTPLPALE